MKRGLPGKGSLKVLQRNIDVWKTHWLASFTGNLGQPIIYLFVLGFGLGKLVPEVNGIDYFSFLAPGILVAAAMNSASYESTFGAYTRMIHQKSYEAILVTPVSLSEVVLGDIYYGALRGFLSGVLLTFLLVFLGIMDLFSAMLCLPLVLLTGLLFASLSLIVTAISPSYEFFSYYLTLVITPMFLISGVFFPLDSLPYSLRVFAWCLPLTHAVDMARSLIHGSLSVRHLLSLILLILFTVISTMISIHLVRRRLIH